MFSKVGLDMTASRKMRTEVSVLLGRYAVSTGKELQTFRKGNVFSKLRITNFDVLLTVHLSIILVINQLNAQNLVL